MATKNISGEELEKIIEQEKDNVEIVDVREIDEFDLIKIKGSKLVPLSRAVSQPDEIDWSKKVVLVCRSGSRSAYVASMLAKDDREIYNLQNGIYELFVNDSKLLEKGPDGCEGYF